MPQTCSKIDFAINPAISPPNTLIGMKRNFISSSRRRSGDPGHRRAGRLDLGALLGIAGLRRTVPEEGIAQLLAGRQRGAGGCRPEHDDDQDPLPAAALGPAPVLLERTRRL